MHNSFDGGERKCSALLSRRAKFECEQFLDFHQTPLPVNNDPYPNRYSCMNHLQTIYPRTIGNNCIQHFFALCRVEGRSRFAAAGSLQCLLSYFLCIDPLQTINLRTTGNKWIQNTHSFAICRVEGRSRFTAAGSLQCILSH